MLSDGDGRRKHLSSSLGRVLSATYSGAVVVNFGNTGGTDGNFVAVLDYYVGCFDLHGGDASR